MSSRCHKCNQKGRTQYDVCDLCIDRVDNAVKIYEAFVREASVKDFPVNLSTTQAFERCSRDLMIEAAEIADALKKIKPSEEVLLEAGDTLWYLTLMILMCGSTLEDVMISNMRKLKERQGKK